MNYKKKILTETLHEGHLVNFSLRFDENAINNWAEKNTNQDYLVFQNEIGPAVQQRGYMNRLEFLEMCKWKSPRTKSRCAINSEEFVNDVTGISLAAQNEQLRIQALTLLSGVSWPTASVFLHFCARAREEYKYPILDFRTLWSLGVEQPTTYTFKFWWEYTEYCRALAKRHGITMRTLDRALWQYSKEKQKT